MTTQEKLLDYLKRTSADLHRARRRIDELEARDQEPIALVAMACRFPGGVNSPEDLWRLVSDETDAITPFPTDRGWDVDALADAGRGPLGAEVPVQGGFLDDPAAFDPEFFGISPHEALAMDPQQRILLEITWEALERGGIVPGGLRGRQVGVFMGTNGQDYRDLLVHEPALGLGVNVAAASVAGRLSYTFGLQGPSVTVDTACSASLVAMHLAARSLRAGECELALAGGATVMSTPVVFAEFARQGGLAADGRSKAFSDAADGTSWSEGAGVLVLERACDARRHGHRILALLRGSAINSDGASNGFTAPNGRAQRQVIEAALADARLAPDDVDAVEAHGTGTRLGDPIEAEALLSAYGQRRAHPLLLGSLKSNIGHTQAAAGAGGVIKTVMALQHGILPRTLHIDRPSSRVRWSAGQVALLTERQEWPDRGRARRAGVSAFGATGTNAHVILEQAEENEVGPGKSGAPAASPLPVLLSARDPQALKAQASALAVFLERERAPLADVGLASAVTRTAFEHRAVVLGAGRTSVIEALTAMADGAEHPALLAGRVSRTEPVVAFVFPGQGAQRLGMGKDLYRRFSAFAAAFDEVLDHLGERLRDVVWGGDEAVLDRTDNTQPALFAVEVASARLLESWGVRAEFVAGHSIGEIAAAHIAGVLSLADACTLVSARGRLMQRLPGGGAMVSVRASEAEVADALGADVAVAAVNGDASLVLSGPQESVRRVAERFGGGQRLPVSHAFHSSLMDPVLDEFRQVVSGLRFHAPVLPMVSTVTGAIAEAEQICRPGYWVEHARRTVRFFDAVRSLAEAGATAFVEVGPSAVLSGPTAAAAGESEVTCVPFSRRAKDEVQTALSALARLHIHGVPVDWAPVFGEAAPCALPTYAFQRRRFWPARRRTGETQGPAGHPLLDHRIDLPGGQGAYFTGRLSTDDHPWLADHKVGGAVLLPGTAFAELAAHAAAETADETTGALAVGELVLESPLPVDAPTDLLIHVGPADGAHRRSLTFHSRPEGTRQWSRNAVGELAPATDRPAFDAVLWPPAGAERLETEGLYESLAGRGYGYGPVFRGLRAAWRAGEDVHVETALHDAAAARAEAYGVHPALLDAALHALPLLAPGTAAVLPFSWRGVRVYRTGATSLRIRLRLLAPLSLSLTATDAAGSPVAEVGELVLREAPPGGLRTTDRAPEVLHTVEWVPVTADGPTPRVTVLDEAAGPGPAPSTLAVPLAAGTDVVASAHSRVARALELAQDDRYAGSRLVFVTWGAVGDGAVTDPGGAAVWGLVRSAQSEDPGRFVLVDLDPEETGGDAGRDVAGQVAQALGTGEPQVVIRSGRAYAGRLARRGEAGPEADGTAAGGTAPGGTWLVTGGTSGLGALTARHLVTAHRVRRLLLVSRRGTGAPGVGELTAELTRLGAQVTVAGCDVADRDALAQVLAGIPAAHPLTGVVHAAGVVDDGLVSGLTPARVSAVMRPKADAAWHLHELTRDLPVKTFVLFSSAAGVLGTAGQGAYAAGNAFLDSLARHRHRAGLPAVAVDWGLWEHTTAISARLTGTDRRRLERNGTAPLTVSQGLQVLDTALAGAGPALVAVPFDVRTPRDNADVPSVLRGLVPAPPEPAKVQGNALAARLTGLAEAERERYLLSLVTGHSALVLGHTDSRDIDADQAFRDMGFDSLAAVELRNRLASASGLTLPASAGFDHPSPRALARHLAALLSAGSGVSPGDAGAGEGAAVADDPIVIVGMACRYPGDVRTPEDLWRLVHGGVDAISGFPEDRGWEPGDGSFTPAGGFLRDAAGFDADFFGISPREAVTMDPQERILLELSWEAVERAGIAPTALRGSRTGVFAGVMYHDYGIWQNADRTGRASAGSMVSGRVAYSLGLEGPAVTVDTACSSSLVALHQAVQALRAGDCTLALAGGVTVLATPQPFVEFARQQGLSSDGRCRSFGAAADGVGWAEGAGLLVLERLSDARRLGHRVAAVVRGSAVNSDGASNGITAPNGPAQQRVIQRALAVAGLRANEVDVVEGHGTGTTLGDPIEAQALLATYGQQRESSLLLGSVKSNLGHTQAAAGVAGIIKMVLAMEHGSVPATLHAEEPSRHVDWSTGRVELVTTARPWPDARRPRRAAVSSFGISGTNAHVIVEEPPRPAPSEPAAETGTVPYVLSAKSEAALGAQLRQLMAHVRAHPALSAADVGFSLATGRARLRHRAVLLPDGAVLAEGTAGGGGCAFLFSGQGAQRPGMGAELYARFPVFTAAFDELADSALRDLVLTADEAVLARTEFAQPALFALEVALFRLLESWGLAPDAVAGHSIGEIAAAHAAGVFTAADAHRMISARGRLMGALPAGGAMGVLRAAESDVRAYLGEHPGRVAVAAVNGPRSVVVSGEAAAVTALGRHFGGVRLLRVSHAFHSPLMEPVLDDFRAVARSVTYRTPRIPMVSTVTGARVTEEVTDPEYWVGHITGTVLFDAAVRTLAADGVRTFLEIGPAAALSALGAEIVDDAAFIPVLRPGPAEDRAVLTAVARAHVRGVPVDWAALSPKGRTVPLPTYPFQHEPYWLPATRRTGRGGLDHPVLETSVALPGTGGHVLTGRVSAQEQPWIADHAVMGTVLLPGTGFVELACRAGEEVGCPALAELVVEAPLTVPAGTELDLRVELGAPDASGDRTLSLHARPADAPPDTPWTRHARGTVTPRQSVEPADLRRWPPDHAEPVDVAAAYDRLALRGYGYGPAFRGLRAAWRRGDDLFAEVELPAPAEGYRVHPALLDAALHVRLVVDDDDRAVLPFVWSETRLHATGASTVRVRVRTAGDSHRVDLADATGAPVATVGSLVGRPVTADRPAGAAARRNLLWRTVWDAVPDRQGDLPAPPTVDDDWFGRAEEPVPPLVVWRVPGDDRPERAVSATLAVLQTWLGDPRFAASHLVLTTRGAQPVNGDEDVTSLGAAAVWGLVRAAQAEHPHRFVLLDGEPVPALAAAVAAGEYELAVRDRSLLRPRLAPCAPGVPRTGSAPWPGTGTVLITGGTSGLGALVARHLVATGVTDLLLVSRSGLAAPGARGLREELTARGATVRVAACDVSDRAALAELLGAEPDLSAVVHAAGTADNAMITDVTGQQVEAGFAAKVRGAHNLHELTAGRPLSAFVLFSSTAALVAGAGQGVYAASNAFLDGLAARRRAASLPATSLAWGLWDTPAGGTAGASRARRMRRLGMPPLAPAEALDLLAPAIGTDAGQVVAVRLDLAALRARADEVPPLLGPLAGVTARRAVPAAVSRPLADRLRGLTGQEQDRLLTDLVRGHVAAVLGHGAATAVGPERAFTELGIDSLASVELRNLLGADTGLTLPATLVFDHPTAAAVAHRLKTELAERAEADDSRAGAADQAEAEAGTPADEPVAIIGMSCRFPGGADSPEALWTLLAEGRDAVGPPPTDRGWDPAELAGVPAGGFLHDAAAFDPGLFGISPAEATATDPQQRLLLEAGWEALERAGIPPLSLKGSRTGVYTGVMYHDYPGTTTGGSAVPGRVAYQLGLDGAAMTVDTACSSSLVALHLAVQSLRSGESELALAGGVTVLSTAQSVTVFEDMGVLSPDGRCHAYAKSANGAGWAEGVGVLVLERLSDARRRGHHVLAVVTGTAVNSDGASNGFTAPSGPAQQRVIRRALAAAGLDPSEVDAVEGHGTGTRLGDPIEVQALQAVYGAGRPHDRPLWLGSVKSNLGHTQAAAGVAGVIKMVLAMRHGVLPASLHCAEPSPHIDWRTGGVRLLTRPRPWSADGPRRAGVSSFGMSGVNAHVIVEQAPAAPPAAEPAPLPVVPWVLSGHSPEALRAQAARLLSHVRSAPDSATGIGLALATTRSALSHRAVVLGADHAELTAALDALARGGRSPQVVLGDTRAGGRTAFLFTGQGAQRTGMGRGLYERHHVFAEAFDQVADRLAGSLRQPLDKVVFDHRHEALLNSTGHAQAALFALEVALFRLVESWGGAPDLLLGHSVGELAAAHVAGVLTLDDACTLVAARGRLMDELPARGAMVAVRASEREVREHIGALAERAPRVSVAAVNGPRSTVVSGDEEIVAGLAAALTAAGHRTTRLRVSGAFHSPLVDPMLEEFRRVVRSLAFHPPRITMVSASTGRIAAPDVVCDPDHWVRQVRDTVRFADGLDTLRREGVTRYLEVGPDPVLCSLTGEALADTQAPNGTARVVPALRAGADDTRTVLSAVATVYVSGGTTSWEGVFAPGRAGRRAELPTYAFQHARHWIPPRGASGEQDRTDRFWDAVENGAPAALADSLGVDEPSLAAVLPALRSWHELHRGQGLSQAWRYKDDWRPLPVDGAPPTGTWAVVVPPDAAGAPWPEAVRDALARTAEVRYVEAGAALPDGDIAGIVSFLAWDARVDDGVPRALTATVELLRSAGGAPLWVMTRGAVSAGDGVPVGAPEQAQLWGFGRVAALEHPRGWGGLVDLPAEPSPGVLRNLLAVIGARQGEDQIAVRPAGVRARRLVPAPPPALPHPGTSWRARGTVLVTGGTGALGSHVARWLADRGAERLLLAGRRGEAAPGAAELLAELAGKGVPTTVVTCDVADRDAVARLLEEIPAHTPLTAVFHTAGVLDDGVIDSLGAGSLATVARPKALGARHLHELTLHHDLDAFVLFSSVAGVLGAAGQAGYAAANAYLDALADHRAATGRPATSVAWGAWAGAGMAGEVSAATTSWRGMEPMEPRVALAALQRVLEAGERTLTIADLRWEQLVPAFTAVRPSPLLSELPGVRSLPPAAVPPARAAAVDGLAGLTGRALQDALLDLVRAEAADLLGHPDAGAVDPRLGFGELGLDSLGAVELRNRLSGALGLSLPATLLFDHPSATRTAGHLASLLRVEPDAPNPAAGTLAELDRLERALRALTPEQAEGLDLGARLRALASLVPGASDDTVVEPSELAADASADDVFAFFDREIG
ncbi:type I polyketide synthase [Streptomyces violaceorubidus]|uniref:Type I polyketide synthase n=1 Tax=Streptomyces violaceorubidus TaxID=284042 RepID=A0ABV1T2Y5_9ACTN